MPQRYFRQLFIRGHTIWEPKNMLQIILAIIKFIPTAIELINSIKADNEGHMAVSLETQARAIEASILLKEIKRKDLTDEELIEAAKSLKSLLS